MAASFYYRVTLAKIQSCVGGFTSRSSQLRSLNLSEGPWRIWTAGNSHSRMTVGQLPGPCTTIFWWLFSATREIGSQAGRSFLPSYRPASPSLSWVDTCVNLCCWHWRGMPEIWMLRSWTVHVYLGRGPHSLWFRRPLNYKARYHDCWSCRHPCQKTKRKQPRYSLRKSWQWRQAHSQWPITALTIILPQNLMSSNILHQHRHNLSCTTTSTTATTTRTKIQPNPIIHISTL